MLCSDTNAGLPAIKSSIPFDKAKELLDLTEDIYKLIEGVKPLGGNADIMLRVRNGEVEQFDTNIRQSRKRHKKIA